MLGSWRKKLFLSSGAVAAALLALPAAAQETPPQPATEAQQEAETEGEEEIVVTGSRIRRSEFSAAAPITIITAERSALAGLIDTSEILQDSTVATGDQINNSFSAFLTNGGPGANSISLRGLGAEKTLVLVNGRRFAPAGSGGTVNSVDLNSIPSAIIDRIEVLKDGASSIYGADAVAGVVNIITRTDLDGGVWGGGANLTEHGGAETYDLTLGWGQVFERGRFDVAMAYSRREEMVQTDREWSECEFSIRVSELTGERTDIDPASGRPYCWDLYSRPHGSAIFAPFGETFTRFDPTLTGANADPFIGSFGIERFTLDGVSPTSRFNPPPRAGTPLAAYPDVRSLDVSQVITPIETFSLTSFGDYSVGGAEFFYEAYYNQREQEISSGWGQFFLLDDTGPGMKCTNPYNPFGLESPIGGFGCFDITPLAPAYALDPYLDITARVLNLTTGVRGGVFNNRFDYEVYAQYGRSEAETEFDSFLETQVARSLDAIRDGSGEIVCRAADLGIDPACVPLDAFAERFILRGELTPEERAYLVGRVGTETTYEQYSLSGYLTGDLFALPAGALKGVVGFEYRNARINDNPDADIANSNLLNLTTAGQTKGSDAVSEAFVELEAPLLRNAMLARSLTANASVRYTDYDSFGDDTTYRFGLDWQVVDAFSVRATYGTSFRAPALFEQFLGDLIGFGDIIEDPCLDYGNNPNLEPTDPVYINCLALGLPLDFATGGGPGYDVLTGGSDDIRAETSEARTIGVVWQPAELGLSVAIDYYFIEVSDEITSLSRTTVLNACYAEVGFTNALCSRIAPRDASGFLTEVDASFVNISSQVREGVDVNMVFEREFEWGTFGVDAEFAYLINASAELLDIQSDFTGEWSFPRWNGQVDFRADWRDWTGFWSVDWIGRSEQLGASVLGTQRRILQTDHHFEHSVSLRYAPADYSITVGVRNLFDEDPPLLSDGASGASATQIFNTIPGAGYDLRGRSLFISLNGRF